VGVTAGSREVPGRKGQGLEIIIIIIINIWNIKTRVIPVIIGATGTISKSFRKYVSTIP
jgi:hypothetical protein